ncbi:MAG: histidine kinase [Microbacterium sp.]|uniref:histidine kinase n=1 Tax=Microbacterium sp. TaxID=51671 RepID=UPI0039E64884
MSETTTVGGAERLAGVLVMAEGVVLVVLTLWQAVSLVGGDTDSVPSAIALLVLTLIGAAAVAAFGAGVLRDRSWGRSGGIVTQLLVLAVAGGAATGAYAHPAIGVVIGVPALVVLILLVIAVVRASRRRPADD